MKCEACGGDGQIEYGAYRGDEAGPTRECLLCGGVVTKDGPLAAMGVTAAQAATALNQLASAGVTMKSSVLKRGPGVVSYQVSAVEQAAERLEQLRLENERLQREAEAVNYEPTTSARAADAEMNDLIRGML